MNKTNTTETYHTIQEWIRNIKWGTKVRKERDGIMRKHSTDEGELSHKKLKRGETNPQKTLEANNALPTDSQCTPSESLLSPSSAEIIRRRSPRTLCTANRKLQL